MEHDAFTGELSHTQIFPENLAGWYAKQISLWTHYVSQNLSAFMLNWNELFDIISSYANTANGAIEWIFR